jgi:hypothetical protein
MALFSRMYDVRLLCMIYSIYRHDRSSKNQEPYLCDQNRTDSAQKIYQLIPEPIMFEDFASEVKYLIDTASKVREQKQKSKVKWDSSTDSVKRGVEIFRSRILKHIDDMKKEDGLNNPL